MWMKSLWLRNFCSRLCDVFFNPILEEDDVILYGLLASHSGNSSFTKFDWRLLQNARKFDSLCMFVFVGCTIACLHALLILVSCAASRATLCHRLSESATAKDPSAKASTVSFGICDSVYIVGVILAFGKWAYQKHYRGSPSVWCPTFVTASSCFI